jgi:predicted acylesterase/phospholipase RssA
VRSIEAVLYLVAEETEAQARKEMEAAGGKPRRGAKGKDWMVLAAHNRTYQLNIVTDVSQALSMLGEHYYNFVVLDDRSPGNPGRGGKGTNCLDDSPALMFMDRVHYSADPERMYPLDRIVAVLDPGECLADQAFEMGKRRIGGYVVQPFDGSLFDLLDSISERRDTPGKAALCLSGGGVEGFLFEVGVLKALNAHLQSRSVTDLDIFCGISAGAIVTAFLANGTQPEEIASAITGGNSEALEAVTPAIIFDPHFKEYMNRLWLLASRAPFMSVEQLISSVLKTVPTGFFKGDALKSFIETQLNKPGRTDDFRQLKKELYIGATDQDTSLHTIFGAGQWMDIPISMAVRASAALTPFFEPQKIRGRYFVDGQYTRTSNFHFAIERGAKLVIVVDPLVPIKTERPGYVREKGGVFSGIQALKAVIHTRFMHGIRHAVENNPEVDFVVFQPESEDMRLMSGSPMKYNIRTEILNMAYRCTVRKIQRDFEILSGTFAKHGFRIQRHPRLRSYHHQVA